MADAVEGVNIPLEAGGSGTTLYTQAVTGGVQHIAITRSPQGETLGVAMAFAASNNVQTGAQYNTAIATAGAGTLTAVALLGGLITRTGPSGAYTDTTDTAALIQAAWPGATGSSFEFEIKNTVPFAETIAAGVGVTLAGQTIIPPNSVGRFLAVWTGLNTITITGISIAAMTAPPLRVNTALTTNGAGTITAAGIAGGATLRSVPTVAFTDTSDTAVAIVAALPNAVIGQSFDYLYVNNSGVLATIAGGVGVSLTGTLVPANSWARYLVTLTSLTAVTMVKVAAGPNIALPAAQFTTFSGTTGTFAAGAASGSAIVYFASTGATPGAQLMRTPAQVLADSPGLQVGMSYTLRILNTGAGTLTLTTDSGSGFTMTGTMTVAQNVWTDFIVTLTAATTGIVQNVGKGTIS